MKLKKIIPIVAVAVLSSCSLFNKNKDKPKDPKPALQIPTIDVENLSVSLPTKPVYNQGSIRSDENFEYIDLYEVSDFHGAVNYKPSSSGSTAYIGLPKLATYFNNKREENKGGTVILSSGDMFQGSAESNLTRGFLVNYAMNYMGFDAMAIGNHEFDWTDEWLKKNANLKYNNDFVPFLGANIFDKATSQMASFLKQYTIVERGEYKIGVIGTIGNDLQKSILASAVAGYSFEEESPIVEALASDLKTNQGCDAVVWLTHQGLDLIPSAPAGVDAIFGGHAHENKQKLFSSVPAVATKNYGQGIAHIELKFNKDTHDFVSPGQYGYYETQKADCELLENNSDILNLMSQYDASINAVKNIKLAHTNSDLEISGALKGICCKSIFEAAINTIPTILSDVPKEQVVASFHNVSGGIRDNIKAGDITYGSVFSSFPFDNEVVLLKFKGAFIASRMSSISNLGTYQMFGGDPSYFNARRDEYFYFVTTDFLATSPEFFNNRTGFGIIPITEESIMHTGLVVRDVVSEFIYNLDEVNGNDFMNKPEYYMNVM